MVRKKEKKNQRPNLTQRDQAVQNVLEEVVQKALADQAVQNALEEAVQNALADEVVKNVLSTIPNNLYMRWGGYTIAAVPTSDTPPDGSTLLSLHFFYKVIEAAQQQARKEGAKYKKNPKNELSARFQTRVTHEARRTAQWLADTMILKLMSSLSNTQLMIRSTDDPSDITNDIRGPSYSHRSYTNLLEATLNALPAKSDHPYFRLVEKKLSNGVTEIIIELLYGPNMQNFHQAALRESVFKPQPFLQKQWPFFENIIDRLNNVRTIDELTQLQIGQTDELVQVFVQLWLFVKTCQLRSQYSDIRLRGCGYSSWNVVDTCFIEKKYLPIGPDDCIGQISLNQEGKIRWPFDPSSNNQLTPLGNPEVQQHLLNLANIHLEARTIRVTGLTLPTPQFTTLTMWYLLHARKFLTLMIPALLCILAATKLLYPYIPALGTSAGEESTSSDAYAEHQGFYDLMSQLPAALFKLTQEMPPATLQPLAGYESGSPQP